YRELPLPGPTRWCPSGASGPRSEPPDWHCGPVAVISGADEFIRPGMLLIDVSHTSHTRARTGVQRVVRSLLQAMTRLEAAEAVTFDPYRRCWRVLESWERTILDHPKPAAGRSARWPWHARWRG